jgi:proteasome lid subunit RPN8/RPN11
MAPAVRVLAHILDRMVRHARSQPGMECCGLLAGRSGLITSIFPAENALASPAAYEIAPRELFSFFRRMREQQIEHLGIYHSHPASENVPSARDIERAFYPELAYFIISPQYGAPKPVRAFSIQRGVVQELELVITNS